MNFKKIIVNLLCSFVPTRRLRRKIRSKFLSNQPSTQACPFERVRLLTATNISALKLHEETFGTFKNSLQGKSVVIVATGPSLRHYKPIENAIHIGVNRAFAFNKIKFDYLFMADYTGLHYIESAKDCPAIKFYGLLRHDMFALNGRSPLIPESIALRHGARRYYVNAVHDCKIQMDLDFVYDLNTSPVTCYGSVVFHALQFALFCNPDKIYLVGCDVNHSGYFDSDDSNKLGLDCVIKGWDRMKVFSQVYYPSVEITSVNPVSLRGYFNDLDQV